MPPGLELDSRRQKPLCLGTSPFSWTCGLGCFGRPGGRECSAPHHSERVPPPLKLHAPSLPPLSGSTMRAAAHTRHSGNAAHADRGPTCMCVRRPRPLVRGCVWRHRGARARDACVPPSVGETEPTPPPRGATPTSRSRRMPPGHRTAPGGHTPDGDVGPVGLPRSALQSRPMRG